MLNPTFNKSAITVKTIPTPPVFIQQVFLNIIVINTATGGVLDSSELNKINDILHEDEIYNGITLEKRDWKDISSIIDDALEEVKEYEFDLKNEPMKTYNLVLSKYGIDELRPLLEKFDQTIIDKIASGQTIDLRVSLRDINR